MLELIQMWQGLRLKTEEQNQFLGDMFEYFLDNGIKQSEGQFFTPVPICKFIVSSLPLENQLQHKSEPLNAIDYACGSGHFLTEYALQIKPLVAKHKQAEPADYYRHTIGIEKEDRLAKVAKISAFMYGLDEIKILDADALAPNAAVKDESFDVLVANPPFAVEDFLMTLAEEDRENYSLLEAVNDIGNKNIQCFFLERAKQLLAGNGVAGIVVPSSVLSNADAMHIQTREILLKFFDIVSIAELGGGKIKTFGKTPTNTVVLFLRRRAQHPEPATHYWNRAQDFFENWAEEQQSGGGAYLDLHLVRQYCQHIDIPFDDYQTLLAGAPSAKLLATEMFVDYQTEFINQTEIKNLKKSPAFKTKSEQAQQAELDKRQLTYLQTIEKQKLYYFMLATSQPNPVLVIKSPNDNNAQKSYLGYEWSDAKGSEGIIYNGGDTVYDIVTPLFDPNNTQNPDKINYYIQQNFMGLPVSVPESLQTYISQTPLADLLDFSRHDFNKAIGLTVKKHNVVSSKWSLVKLGDVAEINPSKNLIKHINGDVDVSFVEMASVSNSGFIAYKVDKLLKDLRRSSYTYFAENDIIIAKITPCMENGKCALATGLTNGLAMGSSEFHVIRVNESVLNQYLFALLNRDLVRKEAEQNMTGSSGHRRVPASFYQDYKIPLPPLDVQQQIVTECEAIDQAVIDAQTKINQAQENIRHLISSRSFPQQKLGNVANKVIATIDPNTQTGSVIYVGLENIESNSGSLVGEVQADYASIKSNKTCFIEHDVLYGKLRPNLNKVYLAKEVGICSTDILVFRFENKALAKFYAHYLLTEAFNQEVLKGVSGQQLPRTSWEKMQSIKIPVPPLAVQTQLVAEIEQLEQRITESRAVITQAASLKQAVMQKYL